MHETNRMANSGARRASTGADRVGTTPNRVNTPADYQGRRSGTMLRGKVFEMIAYNHSQDNQIQEVIVHEVSWLCFCYILSATQIGLRVINPNDISKVTLNIFLRKQPIRLALYILTQLRN